MMMSMALQPPPNPFQTLGLDLKLSAGTPIEAILEAASKIIDPIMHMVEAERESMSQNNKDRIDLLRIVIQENLCIALGLVRPEQLERHPPTLPFVPVLPESPP